MAQQAKHAEKEAAAWNAANPAGTEVRYYPALGGKEFRETKTTSRADVLGGHTAVVSVEGVGLVAVENCEPLWATP